MKKFVVGILALITLASNAQTRSDCMLSVAESDIEFCSVINGDTILQKKVDKALRRKKADNKTSYIFFNGEPIDSTGIRFSSYPFLIGKEICFYHGKQDEIYGYIPEERLEVKSGDMQNLNYHRNFITTRVDDKIFLVNSSFSEYVEEMDVKEFVNKEVTLGGDYESLASYYKLCDIEYALIKATCNISCWDYEVYIYNLANKEYKRIDWISKGEGVPGVKFGIVLSNRESTYCLAYIVNSNDSNKNGEWLLDDQLNPISKTLSKHQIRFDGYNGNLNKDYNFPKVAGVNYKQDQIDFYYLSVVLDNKDVVFVPYDLNVSLELLLYNAYHNRILTKEDLKGFGEYEFGIIRNLIFAKYNYDFTSEFYQAYFNLFAFYNAPEMRKSRTKDVNSKLTEADKANLELIKSME
ncbi:MAG: YARHG domain-containing protein [Salinivirgaceae bacterium]|jgi:hypothetical protein|nr:YARHG domain-containing protein [Salinivirgaceae bacterium]